MIYRIYHSCSCIIKFIKLIAQKKKKKKLDKPHILSLFLNSINKFNKTEHSCKILFICNKGSTHVRSSISATRGAPCKILYICNKGSTHVRSSISATRGALMYDPLYLQQGELSCKILYKMHMIVLFCC